MDSTFVSYVLEMEPEALWVPASALPQNCTPRLWSPPLLHHGTSCSLFVMMTSKCLNLLPGGLSCTHWSWTDWRGEDPSPAQDKYTLALTESQSQLGPMIPFDLMRWVVPIIPTSQANKLGTQGQSLCQSHLRIVDAN